MWRRQRQRSALAGPGAAACTHAWESALSSSAVAGSGTAGKDSEDGSTKLGSRSCEDTLQQQACDGASARDISHAHAHARGPCSTGGAEALGPSLPGLARLHRRNPAAHRTCVLLAAAGCYEVAILGQNIGPGLVDPSVGELGGGAWAGFAGGLGLLAGGNSRPPDRAWRAARLAEHCHCDCYASYSCCPLSPAAVMLLSLFTVVCVAVLSRLWLKTPVQWAAVVPAAAVMLGGAAMVLVPDIKASKGTDLACLQPPASRHQTGSTAHPSSTAEAPCLSSPACLSGCTRILGCPGMRLSHPLHAAAVQGGAGEPGSLTTGRAWLGFGASVAAMLGNSLFIIIAQASRSAAPRRFETGQPNTCRRWSSRQPRVGAAGALTAILLYNHARLAAGLWEGRKPERHQGAICHHRHQPVHRPAHLAGGGRRRLGRAVCRPGRQGLGRSHLLRVPGARMDRAADPGLPGQAPGAHIRPRMRCAGRLTDRALAWPALAASAWRCRARHAHKLWCVQSFLSSCPAAGEHRATGRPAGVPVLRHAPGRQRGGQQDGAGCDDRQVSGAGALLCMQSTGVATCRAGAVPRHVAENLCREQVPRWRC